ncbi:MAG: hypothetical protein JXA99_01895 [Candidatus Lokiarchaeota archaeon]|nr:hypothetical protein [Candidatus Lokiarchaeota archaeon]
MKYYKLISEDVVYLPCERFKIYTEDLEPSEWVETVGFHAEHWKDDWVEVSEQEYLAQNSNNVLITRLLSEQHRNAMHDAVDEIINISNEYSDKIDSYILSEMILKITRSVINLKQRTPNI